jgi:hypothetical protein
MMDRAALLGLGLLAATPAAAQTLSPGQWDMQVNITKLDAPSLPPAMVAAMMQKPTRIQSCITPQDVAKAPERVFTASNGSCKTEEARVRGGSIRTRMVCNASGTRIVITSTGRYTATTFDVTAISVMTGQGMAMTTHSRTLGKRTGACKA